MRYIDLNFFHSSKNIEGKTEALITRLFKTGFLSHLCQSLYCYKVADLRPSTLFKKVTLAQVSWLAKNIYRICFIF